MINNTIFYILYISILIEGELPKSTHVLGYIRAISPEKYAKLKDKGYKLDDKIGVSGIEAYAEKQLKGVDGYKKIEIQMCRKTKVMLRQEPLLQ